jgi:predicted GNAT family acetyltransferase
VKTRVLDHFSTPQGEPVHIRLVIPPAPDYAKEIRGFLAWIDAENFRSITSRLAGDFQQICDDRYFFAEIDGEVIGQMWYGWGRHEAPVANFGQVFVATRHRKKGIAQRLFATFQRHFADNSPSVAAFCSTGNEWVANIYRCGGFRCIDPKASYGPLYCPKPGQPEIFDDFAEAFYRGHCDQPAQIHPATMAYRHEIDCVLKFTLIRKGLLPEPCPSFQQAYFDHCDGKGTLQLYMSAQNRALGWRFIPQDGSEQRGFMHPDCKI